MTCPQCGSAVAYLRQPYDRKRKFCGDPCRHRYNRVRQGREVWAAYMRSYRMLRRQRRRLGVEA